MPTTFNDNRANFSGMDGGGNWLYITDVMHKAFVDVNELGTEAGGSTGLVVRARAVPERKFFLRVYHPFIFLIRDTIYNSILLIGRVVNPLQRDYYFCLKSHKISFFKFFFAQIFAQFIYDRQSAGFV